MGFDKKNNVYKTIMLILVTAIITFLITTFGLYNYYKKTDKGKMDILLKSIEISDSTNDLEKKIEVLDRYLNEYYYKDITPEDKSKLINSALKGYVEGLEDDDYTEYLTPEEYDELMINITGNYVGIGIYMSQYRDGNVVILLPIEDSPAEEAGLKTGDIIVKINGEECKGKELSIVANKVKGEEGTTVELEILRDTETITKTITRKAIEIKDMNSEILENNIGYIKILSFDEEVSKQFESKLKEFKEKNIKSLIIDLRDNGGGVVSEAIDIADMLIPKDKNIMITINKNGEEEITKSKNDSLIDGMNLVVLVNENSASASEILVGALQDNNVAKIVGTRTFGKGVMQELFPISSIGGALKVTIQEFKTANGNIIDKSGIIPDIVVEQSEDIEKDEQLQRAIEISK